MAKIEKAKITFEHEDGRKIIINVENNEENNETVMKSDFGSIPPEAHSPGIHGELYAKLMMSISYASKDKPEK